MKSGLFSNSVFLLTTAPLNYLLATFLLSSSPVSTPPRTKILSSKLYRSKILLHRSRFPSRHDHILQAQERINGHEESYCEGLARRSGWRERQGGA
jgi:hypothetical protein